MLLNITRDFWLRFKRIPRVISGTDKYFYIQERLNGEKHGTVYGGWTICPDIIDSDSVVYSFGIGKDISFDLSIIAKYGVTVHAFDPTPISLEWLKEQKLPKNLHYYPYGIANYDGIAKFAPPKRSGFTSFSMSDQADQPNIELPVHRLSTIMQKLNHSRIDILKMDIEGAEYDVIADILTNFDSVKISQILVEFHYGDQQALQKVKDSIVLLNCSGYRTFDVSAGGREFSFLLKE